MGLYVDPPPRARQRRVIRRRRGQLQVQERPQTQRIGHPPRNPPLRRQTLEIADEQHPEIPTRTQTRTAQPVRVESRAQLLDERIESGIRQDPVQPLEVRMPVARRKVRRVHPHRRRLARRRSLAHCHGRSVYGLDRAGARPDPRLSPQAVNDRARINHATSIRYRSGPLDRQDRDPIRARWRMLSWAGGASSARHDARIVSAAGAAAWPRLALVL